MAEEINPLERAKALALRVLAFHARSEAQLRTRLAKGGFPDEAEEVVVWLRRLGYLDDAAYAKARARELLAPGRAGPRMAERRLRAAGIDAAAAAGAVCAAADERAQELSSGREPAEMVLCRAALARKLRGADPAALDARARAGLARFLLGRGFSGSVVARVVGMREDLDLGE